MPYILNKTVNYYHPYSTTFPTVLNQRDHSHFVTSVFLAVF